MLNRGGSRAEVRWVRTPVPLIAAWETGLFPGMALGLGWGLLAAQGGHVRYSYFNGVRWFGCSPLGVTLKEP